MSDITTLSGFHNIDGLRLEGALFLGVVPDQSDYTSPAVTLRIGDYDSPQELAMEALQWARRHGRKDPASDELEFMAQVQELCS